MDPLAILGRNLSLKTMHASIENDSNINFEGSLEVEDKVIEKNNELVDHRVDLNNHEDELEPIKEKDEFEEPNMIYLSSFSSALTFQNIGVENIIQLTLKEE